jgi:hypothetical protein
MVQRPFHNLHENLEMSVSGYLEIKYVHIFKNQQLPVIAVAVAVAILSPFLHFLIVVSKDGR